ncbi:nuclear speckle splicing regulatory protein 1 [Anopheles maculipalpis]|uniref:nuclear speckle splicing regulatory protein 1 n=1 Tax=Anopheles maculipalpis TaxID=1496333 RepID=UPI0021592C7C|nr:nuclear speckle splicing regulatory protein 1 [Anopheles maculipalpis]
MSKKYGLIERGTDSGPVKKHAAFASDSDSDDAGTSKVSIELGAVQKRQAQAMQQKAVEEDPTIYQYDELYDDMVEQREKSSAQAKEQTVDRKPKYIGKLMETAERRKKEQERRIERQVQKERDAEGEKFKDKESFVTSAYRAKLEEMKKLEEQEKREEYLETIGDVTKQSDLGGFYRHIYEQKVKDEAVKEEVKEEKVGRKDSARSSSEERVEKREEKRDERPKPSNQRERKYRKRKSDDENDDQTEDREPTERTHLQSNLDADSDFSIDSDSSDSSESEEDDKNKSESAEDVKETNGHTKSADTSKDLPSETEPKEDTEEPEIKKPKPPPIDIWKKRTVGDVFEAARQRYFERRQMQESC